MKRLLMLLALLPCLGARADGVFKAFTKKVGESTVSFSFKYSTRTDVPITGTGSVSVAGDAFLMETAGLQVRCDSRVRWTFDTVAKEVLIESVEGPKDFAGNPALLVSNAGEAFSVVSTGQSKFKDKVVHAVVLSPGDQTRGIDKATLYFNSKDELIGASIVASDGTVTDFEISSLRFSAKAEPSSFRPAEGISDGSWVVTDLR
ncbi:MAG: hypothetical protein IJ795_01360 [Bacteroidales bacterium]|nr:hypothetical protein [Bacteroidales bacterium]